jgi:type I restriction enzyme S subunit
VKDLPKGWVKAKIKDVSIKCVQNKPNDEEKLVYVDIGSINRKLKVIENPQHLKGVDAPSRARKRINTNDVLVSLTRPNLNAIAHVPKDFDEQYASTGFEVIKSVGVDSRYLFALVKTHNFINAITGVVQGALYPAAKSSDVQNYEFPLAPLNEQTRIADKLDSMLAKVDAAQARLDKIPNILKRFRQSVLAAATSGELTKEWREENQVIFNWDEINVSEIVSKIEAGKSIKCEERPPREDEFGIIKISAVTWGKYNEEESKTLKDKSIFLENRRVQVGDFLISRANTLELLGMPVIVHEVTKNLMLSDKVLRLVMDEIEKKWLDYYFRSPMGRTQIENGSSGNQESMRNIGQKALMAIILNNPPLDEKKEIIRRVESLFTMADTVEKQYKDAKGRTNRLTQSILAKAFRGELVPQDTNDEPAVKLLEKIKNDKKTAVIKKPKTNRPSSKRKTAKPKTVSAVNLNAKEVYVTLQANKKEMTPQQIIESMKNDTFETIDQLFVQLKSLLEGSLISQSGFGENAKFKVLKL